MEALNKYFAATLLLTHNLCFAVGSLNLTPIDVTSQAINESLTIPSIEAATYQIELIPGAVDLISQDNFMQGSVSGIQDVISQTPGVFIQSRFGNSETRLSIRGSGITQTFGARGVRVLRDGLPVTDASGFTNPELLDPLTASYVEVYKGANALHYGAATLGGAVNLVSLTGYDMQGYEFRQVIGGNDYLQTQIRGGQVFDNNWDAFFSLSALSQSGFREQSREKLARGFFNIGYKHNELAETRLFLTLHDNNLELPGSITFEQLEDNPNQANANFAKHESERNLDRYRIDLQHSRILSDGGEMKFGLFYERRELDHPLPFLIIDSSSNDYGMSFTHSFNMNIGVKNDIRWGILAAEGNANGDQFRVNFAQGGGPSNKGALNKRTNDDALTLEAFLHGNIHLNQQWDLIVGLQGISAERHSQEDFVNPATADIDVKENYTGWSPKLGLLWKPAEDWQIFTNISRSFEPPTNIELANALNDAALDAQKSTTIEIGTRGKQGLFSWDLAAYYAELEDEILFQERPPIPSGQFDTDNADDTIHKGVELGLQLNIPLGLVKNDKLLAKSVYTYSRFNFDGDDSFNDNELPGIPTHFGNLSITYQHPSGYYAGPTMEWASDYNIDFANSLEAENYTIYGFKFGYKAEKGISWFVEAKNLENDEYISNTGVTANANGQDRGLFNPGLTRTVFAGMTIPF
jgi:iron complex outermembrane recepter protein